MQTPKAESSADLHSVLVQTLGLAIAEGTLAPHSILRLDELETQHGVSRSVVREATPMLMVACTVTPARVDGVERTRSHRASAIPRAAHSSNPGR